MSERRKTKSSKSVKECNTTAKIFLSREPINAIYLNGKTPKKKKHIKRVRGEKPKPRKFTKEEKEEITAILRERRNDMPLDKKKRYFNLSWNSNPPISEADEKNMAPQVVDNGDYAPVNDAVKTRILEFIESFSSPMTLSQAISLREALLRQKSMSRNHEITKRKEEIFNEYKGGKSILDLAQDIDCPPCNVFRAVLRQMDTGKKKKVKSYLKRPERLPKREQEELKAVLEKDIVARFDQTQSLKLGNSFEDIIAEFLKEKGIIFVRQDQLVKEQKEEFGKAFSTPDFLLLDEVTINGKKVNWIDGKAYYGANVPYIKGHSKSQISRYIDHWGEGAIIYLYGFNEILNLKLEKCIVLNADRVLNIGSFSPI
mmetsp:Transcript_20284/g.22682  ORF Transcript_20284/g.22682 Transcript_20284/m.22682 type:complete len:371 (+) Transcript_20284:2-1114(+)